jgi:hypothetical protein
VEQGSTTSEHLVFISHSSRDTWLAKQLARGVSESGGTPFLDEADVEIGDDFEEKIRDFLERAHELLVLLTPWAMDRPYVWVELGVAWGRELPIVAVLHGLNAWRTPVSTRDSCLLEAKGSGGAE